MELGTTAFDGVFDQVSRELSGIIPEVASLKESAYQRFSEMGFPTTKDEDWKYTSVQLLRGKDYTPSLASSGVGLGQLEQFLIPDLNAPRVVFVDGHYSPGLSSFRAGGKLSVQPLRALLSSNQQSDLHRTVLTHLGRLADFKDHAFNALNTALFLDGAFVHVREGAIIEAPLHILYVTTGASASLLPVRNLFIAERNSSAHIVESYVTLAKSHYFTTAVTEVVCEEDAALEHTKIQLESLEAAHIARLHVRQQSRSRFSSHVFGFGGSLVRNEIYPILDGDHIECLLNGLTVIGGEQHVDNTTVIDHAKPDCFSRELYKGIYGGRASGVFSGTIIVRPNAQKTNAIQSNNSLLLSGDATIDTRPQLKIYADDVKCTHGATVGQLDENALFYLRSRGISRELGMALLIRAFASDIVSHVGLEPLRRYLEEILIQRLHEQVGAIDGDA